MNDADECRSLIVGMSTSGRILFYLTYAHRVTIVAREFYDDLDSLRLRDCNETLHRLAGHLVKLQSIGVDSATEESFAKMIVADAGSRGWLSMLRRSFTVIRPGSP